MILYQAFCESLEGLSGTSFAQAVGISRRTVGRWRGRNGRLEDRAPHPKERAIWELECHVRRAPGWPFITHRELYQAFGRVMMSLNHEFPRPILGGKTSHRIFTEKPRPMIHRAELRKEVDNWGRAIHEVCPNLRGGEPLYARWAITCALINRGLLKIEGPKLLPFFKSHLGQRL